MLNGRALPAALRRQERLTTDAAAVHVAVETTVDDANHSELRSNDRVAVTSARIPLFWQA